MNKYIIKPQHDKILKIESDSENHSILYDYFILNKKIIAIDYDYFQKYDYIFIAEKDNHNQDRYNKFYYPLKLKESQDKLRLFEKAQDVYVNNFYIKMHKLPYYKEWNVDDKLNIFNDIIKDKEFLKTARVYLNIIEDAEFDCNRGWQCDYYQAYVIYNNERCPVGYFKVASVPKERFEKWGYKTTEDIKKEGICTPTIEEFKIWFLDKYYVDYIKIYKPYQNLGLGKKLYYEVINQVVNKDKKVFRMSKVSKSLSNLDIIKKNKIREHLISINNFVFETWKHDKNYWLIKNKNN